MSSRSLLRWRNESAEALDEIEAAHVAVGGTSRGRRYATQQINQAYVVLLSSRFQAFCRDLHSETVAVLIRFTPAYHTILQGLTSGRKLDQGNPNAGNIGHDFARRGMDLWPEVYTMDERNQRRRRALDEMVDWRNAIGHQDFNKPTLKGQQAIHLRQVQGYRSTCNALAGFFDRAALDHVRSVMADPAATW